MNNFTATQDRIRHILTIPIFLEDVLEIIQAQCHKSRPTIKREIIGVIDRWEYRKSFDLQSQSTKQFIADLLSVSESNEW